LIRDSVIGECIVETDVLDVPKGPVHHGIFEAVGHIENRHWKLLSANSTDTSARHGNIPVGLQNQRGLFVSTSGEDFAVWVEVIV
jgi:hypothetical protein